MLVEHQITSHPTVFHLHSYHHLFSPEKPVTYIGSGGGGGTSLPEGAGVCLFQSGSGLRMTLASRLGLIAGMVFFCLSLVYEWC